MVLEGEHNQTLHSPPPTDAPPRLPPVGRECSLFYLGGSAKMPPRFKSGDEEFDTFYAAYPRKKAPVDALKAWKQTAKIRPPLPEILAAIETQKKSRQWSKDGGKYIPFPASWLRAGRFFDEVETVRPKSHAAPDRDKYGDIG